MENILEVFRTNIHLLKHRATAIVVLLVGLTLFTSIVASVIFYELHRESHQDNKISDNLSDIELCKLVPDSFGYYVHRNAVTLFNCSIGGDTLRYYKICPSSNINACFVFDITSPLQYYRELSGLIAGLRHLHFPPAGSSLQRPENVTTNTG
jgi:hypothetical protein